MMWIIATACALALVASIVMWKRTRGRTAWKIGSYVGALGLIAASGFALAPSASAKPPANLIVSGDAVIPAAAQCTTTTFDPASMQYSKHKWSDSLSTPFVAKTADDIWTEFKNELCTNPSLGDAWAQAEQKVNVTIGDKTWNLGKLNPWLKTMTDKGNHLRKSWLVTSKDGKTITVSKSYRENAEKVLTLLLPFKQQGVKSERSTLNWPANNLVAGELPHAIEASKSSLQESYPALVLSYTHKSGQCDASVGINTGDKRPEIFSCAKPSPAPAPAKTSKATAPNKPAPKTTKPKPAVCKPGTDRAGQPVGGKACNTPKPPKPPRTTPPTKRTTPPPTKTHTPPTKTTPPPTTKTTPPPTTKTTPPPTKTTPPTTPPSSTVPPKCPPGDTDPACHSLPPGSSGTPTDNPPSSQPLPTPTGPTYNPTSTSSTTASSTSSTSRTTPPNEGPTDTATGGPTGCAVCDDSPKTSSAGMLNGSAFLGGIVGVLGIGALFGLRKHLGRGGKYGR